MLPKYRYRTSFSSFEEEQDVLMQIGFEFDDLEVFLCGIGTREGDVSPLGITLIAKAIVKCGFGDIRPL